MYSNQMFGVYFKRFHKTILESFVIMTTRSQCSLSISYKGLVGCRVLILSCDNVDGNGVEFGLWAWLRSIQIVELVIGVLVLK